MKWDIVRSTQRSSWIAASIASWAFASSGIHDNDVGDRAHDGDTPSGPAAHPTKRGGQRQRTTKAPTPRDRNFWRVTVIDAPPVVARDAPVRGRFVRRVDASSCTSHRSGRSRPGLRSSRPLGRSTPKRANRPANASTARTSIIMTSSWGRQSREAHEGQREAAGDDQHEAHPLGEGRNVGQLGPLADRGHQHQRQRESEPRADGEGEKPSRSRSRGWSGRSPGRGWRSSS